MEMNRFHEIIIIVISADGDPKGQSAACAVEYDEHGPNDKQDSFDEVYKPQELTEFDSLFNRNITRTSEWAIIATTFMAHTCSLAHSIIIFILAVQLWSGW